MKIMTINTSTQKTIEDNAVNVETVEQHSILKTLLLHLVPGVLIYLLFLWSYPLFEAWGYPGIMGLVFGGTVVLLPTLGELYIQGKKRHGKFTLKGIVLYRQSLPWWQYVSWTVLAVVYALAVTIFIVPLFQDKVMQFFTWWPGYSARLTLGNYSAMHILIATILYVVLNSLLPVIEELYFRGYLMARISRFGIWTPFINMALFSLYHFWQPWNNGLNMLALWPLAFLAWRTRSIHLSIAIHCTLNIVGMLPLIIGLFIH